MNEGEIVGIVWENAGKNYNVYLLTNTKIESAQTMSVQFLSLKWIW